MQSTIVYDVIETPHEAPSAEWSIFQCSTRQEALANSAGMMKLHLTELYQPGMSTLELFNTWQKTGTGYRIQPEDETQAPFSDIDFARLYVPRLTNDYSHPLFIEISTVDCLQTASGVRSPSKNWNFWVKAPATYEGGDMTHLMVAATEVLYDEMSQQSLQADGSRYVLLNVGFRHVSADEATAAINADKNASVYFVQNDGSFAKSKPVNPDKA